ncbi:MAG TPA: hypothetical protein VF493_12580 [Terriglobales bacterium]
MSLVLHPSFWGLPSRLQTLLPSSRVNRGVGLAFARELLARGAPKVYAGARDPATITQSGVEALHLDVNKPEDVAAAAALACVRCDAGDQQRRHCAAGELSRSR